MTENIGELKKIIEQMHKCGALYVESVPVSETFDGKIVWQGIVHSFSLIDHPKAIKCYAWSSPIEGSTKRRFYAVLNIPPVDSPQKAVRASIVRDHKIGAIK
jgi:hypothetical protein